MQEERLISPPDSVSFVELRHVHDGLKAEILAEISALIDVNAFTNGPQVAAFERVFAAYCGAAFCVGVASGLDALRLGLLAAGIEPGDKVILPALTFVATIEAVRQAGGVPVLADVTEDDYCLDAERAEAAVTGRTRFLLPVHLHGQMADLRALRRLAEERRLAIIEDACQAHGAAREGLRAGTGGLAGAFSFYPTKNLGAMGDAGALVSDDPELAARARALREHGQTAKYEHALEGYTARLDTLQAAVLLHKLPLLEGWNAERATAARFYGESLEGVGDLRLPPVANGSAPAWHVYAVRTAEPERLAAFLREHGIATGRHYPTPIHLSTAYAFLDHERGDFPVAEALAAELLSLPLFPGISEARLSAVADAVRAYFDDG